MARSVTLPSKIFKTKKEAIEFFRQMLNRYCDGEEITKEDSRFLFEVLQRHPEAHHKMGVSGVRRFFRDKTDKHTSCFYLERNDGSTTDFSFNSCISGKAPSIEQEFYRACWNSVSGDLALRKAELFQAAGGILRCAKTGEQVTLPQSEYRHTVPRFQEIVELFITKRRIDLATVSLSESSDMQYATSFMDSKLANDFKIFHAQHAHLDIFKKDEC